MNSSGKGNEGLHRRTPLVARRLALTLCAAGLLAAAGGARPAFAVPPTSPDAGAYATDGPVHAIARAGGRTYIGGEFSRVGLRSGSGVLRSSTGAWQPISAEVAGGDVEAVISDGAGGWYVGGTFTAVGGRPRVGLAHIDANGAVDEEFKVDALDSQNRPGAVYALALGQAGMPDAGRLYVGGEFSKIAVGKTNSTRHNVAVVDVVSRRPSDGSLTLKIEDVPLATRCSTFPNCSPAVRVLKLTYLNLDVTGENFPPQPLLFIGGSFDRIGQAVDAANSEVKGLAAAWGFNARDYNANTIPGEVVFNTASTPVAWAPTFGATTMVVEAIELSDPVTTPTNTQTLAVYAGGHKNGTVPAAHAYQFKLACRSDMPECTTPTVRRARTVASVAEFTKWLPAPSACTSICSVRSLRRSGGTLYLGGDFRAGTGTWIAKIRTVPNPDGAGNQNCDTTAPSPFNCTASSLGAGGTPNVGAPVRSLVLSPSGSTLYAGGDFTAGVAEIATATGAVTESLAPKPDSPVNALAIDPSGSSLYAGGEFRSLQAVARSGLAAFDSAGQLIANWAPNAGASARVHALAASDSTVYAGGQFPGLVPSTAQPATLLAIGAASGSAVPFAANPSYAPDPDVVRTPDVLSLSLLGSTLYVGGAFDRVGGEARSNLAAVDATTGAPSSWNPHVTGGFVYSTLPACGAVYVAGGFSHVGDQSREFLVALDPASGSPTSWNPVVNGIPVGGEVLALAQSGPTIYAGGNFATIGGATRHHVAALDATTGRALEGFNPGANGPVESLAVTDSGLYLGGTFDIVGNEPRLHLASVDPVDGALSGWDPSPDAPVVALTAGGGVYAGGFFESVGTTGQRGFAPFGSGAGSPFAAAECSRPAASVDGSSVPTSGGTLGSGSPGTTPSTSGADGVGARIAQLAVTPAVARLGGRPIAIRFRLSRAARVRFNFERRSRVTCPRRTTARRSGRCVAYRPFASMTRRGRRGVNRVTLPRQRVGRRRLAPGRYRVRVVPIPARRGAQVARAYFTLVRR